MVNIKYLMMVTVMMAACGRESALPGSGSADCGDLSRTPAPELTIVVDVTNAGATGVSNLWDATVREVISGTLSDRTVLLRVRPDPFSEGYAGHFQSIEEKSLKLRLRRIPERPIVLEGFIAADKTIWQLVEVSTK